MVSQKNEIAGEAVVMCAESPAFSKAIAEDSAGVPGRNLESLSEPRVARSLLPSALLSMTFRSEKVSDGKNTVLRLSGRIQSEHLEGLRSQIESNGDSIVMDLEEVTLVDIGVIRFLGSCERAGIELRHCPPFVLEWIAREQEGK